MVGNGVIHHSHSKRHISTAILLDTDEAYVTRKTFIDVKDSQTDCDCRLSRLSIYAKITAHVAGNIAYEDIVFWTQQR